MFQRSPKVQIKFKTLELNVGYQRHSIIWSCFLSSISSSRRTHVILVIITMMSLISSLPCTSTVRAHSPHIASDVIAIKEGADLDLSCPIVVQNEDMIISWTCDNEPANIKSSRIHVTESGKLRIRSAKVGDSCNYRCEAADGFGTLSVLIKVIIVDKRLIGKLNRRNQSSSALNHQQQLQQYQSASQTSQNPLIRAAPYTSLDLLNSNVAESTVELKERQPLNHPMHQTLERYQQRSILPQQTTDPAQDVDLSVQIEPSEIVVEKNHTFSLECKIKHSPDMNIPQIIWLKEFIGRKPETLNEALEQNLIVIEDVYYHSLNWPRSISYSKTLACANSALLIRQAGFVHSGRYICFAGYPPTLTSGTNLTSLTAPSLTNSLLSDGSAKAPKYKMALAVVQVKGDSAGELDHKLKWGGSETRNLLISIFSTDSWIRNLTAILILLVCLLLVANFVYKHYMIPNKKNNKQQLNVVVVTDSAPTDGQSNSPRIPLAIKQLQSLPSQQYQPNKSTVSLLESNHSMTLTEKKECLQSNNLDNNLEQIETKCDEDHLYSEIGDRDRITVVQDQENIYKIPNHIN